MKKRIKIYAVLLLFIGVIKNNAVYGQNTIHLLFPLNGSNVTVSYPIFSWTPIAITAGSTVIYKFKLVEILNPQSPEAAMGNPALYEATDIKSNVYQYPIDAPIFDNCSSYAWQVWAETKTSFPGGEDNPPLTVQNIVAMSEVYSFGFNCDIKINSITALPSFYIVPQKTVDNFVYPVSDSLKFKYEEHSNVTTLNYKIYNWQREVVKQDTAFPITYGWNYLSVGLGSGFSEGEIYQMEIYTPKNDILKIKFEYKE
jgi:hypothetical protein